MPGVDVPVESMEIKYQGIFDYDYFYAEMKKWYNRHGFTDFQEIMHKFKPPEMELGWNAARRDTGYRKTQHNIFFHAWEWKEVEVKVKGKKKKMISAKIKINLGAKQILDYEGNMEKNEFTKTLRTFVHKFIFFYKIFIVDYDTVQYELLDLQQTIRSLLSMSLKGDVVWP